MKILKSITFIFLLVLVFCGCQSENESIRSAELHLPNLEENHARVLFRIDGKQFYPEKSIFTCQWIASNDVLNLILTDQFEGRTMISMVDNKWYAKRPIAASIKPDGSPSSVKIGKLIDAEKQIGEGYMMTSGTITALKFEKDKVILEIKGQVGAYSDFQAPGKLLPLEGIVVCKKPLINFGDISEKEVFGMSDLNK